MPVLPAWKICGTSVIFFFPPLKCKILNGTLLLLVFISVEILIFESLCAADLGWR